MGIRSFLTLKCLSFFIILLPSQALVQGFGTTFENEEAAKQLGKEKFSHFQFYWHDTLSGPNPTAVRVVNPVSFNSPTSFGQVTMIDNPLTEGPNLTSKLVGRAQGFYASACQKELGLLMAMNLAFMEGRYKGSTLTVLGRNMVFTEVREMPVIGGSGLFRFARGYVQARTHSLYKTGDAIVHYDCYVLHY